MTYKYGVTIKDLWHILDAYNVEKFLKELLAFLDELESRLEDLEDELEKLKNDLEERRIVV